MKDDTDPHHRQTAESKVEAILRKLDPEKADELMIGLTASFIAPETVVGSPLHDTGLPFSLKGRRAR